ncbi:MAG: hypothetical protein H6834_08590 [Planctomycetes bacterium]|nr:hypothetical protein [Planctomycetota bacterium]
MKNHDDPRERDPLEESLPSVRFLTRETSDRDQASLSALRAVRVHRPVDALTRRLETEGATNWIESSLALLRREFDLAPDWEFDRGSLGLEILERIKRWSKARFREGTDRGEDAQRDQGLFLYVGCVASAWIHHDRQISSLPHAELRTLFVELASATPRAWRDWLELAITRCDEESQQA